MSGGVLNPLLLLTSPLGDDTLPIQTGTLHAVALEASERISRPFEAWISVVSTERAIDPDELLFQPVCLTIRRQAGRDRFINGVVRSVAASGITQRDRWRYRLQVVPRLSFLDQTTDCRIFQQKTTVQILQELFCEHRVEPVEFRIYGDRPVREYTTQFNETDLVFAHRLMQDSGYFYYFEHDADAHRLIVSDRNQSFKLLDHPLHRVIHEGSNIDVFDRWTETQRTAHGLVRLQDYDPTRPSAPVVGQQATTLSTAGAAQRDLFRWPAATLRNQMAADRARFCIEADEAASGLRDGHGYDPQMLPGGCFVLGRDPFTRAEEIEHVVHDVEHSASDESWITGGSAPRYENRFTCFLQSTPWREPLDIARPAMAGLFSAVVLGNDGEEIHADALARIKVRLLFDRRKDTVATMATWVRIVHAWSGNGWGWQHLPRVGTEVAVSFMNGDPDTPAVTGCFYHQEMRPVFPIPEQQTKQGFRSRSTLHGGTQEYSELSFDDRKNGEMVLLHAQKDYRTEVEHDRSIEIGRDQTVTVTRNHRLATEQGSITIEAMTGSIDITAMTRMTLRVGASSITLTPASIVIAAATVSTEATEVNVSAAAVTTEAAEVNVTAAAVTTEAAEVNIVAGSFSVESPVVTLATAEFIAPIQGT